VGTSQSKQCHTKEALCTITSDYAVLDGAVASLDVESLPPDRSIISIFVINIVISCKK
jgi:hypothetical protein